MTGLKINNIELMKYTNERENKVEYIKLTRALMAKRGENAASPSKF